MWQIQLSNFLYFFYCFCYSWIYFLWFLNLRGLGVVPGSFKGIDLVLQQYPERYFFWNLLQVISIISQVFIFYFFLFDGAINFLYLKRFMIFLLSSILSSCIQHLCYETKIIFVNRISCKLLDKMYWCFFCFFFLIYILLWSHFVFHATYLLHSCSNFISWFLILPEVSFPEYE